MSKHFFTHENYGQRRDIKKQIKYIELFFPFVALIPIFFFYFSVFQFFY